MIIAVPKETKDREKRVALTPDTVSALVKAGNDVLIEAGAGLEAYYDDNTYIAVGARIVNTKNEVYSGADVVLKVNAPLPAEIALMKPNSVLVSFMWAATNP